MFFTIDTIFESIDAINSETKQPRTSPARRPTFLIVPGAWHTYQNSGPLFEQLHLTGYSAQAIKLPTVGSASPATEDTNLIRSCLEAVIESGRDVIPVFHAYAGFPGASALRHLASSERKGNRGAVVGIVWLAGFIPREGKSMLDALGGKHPPWQLVNEQSGTITVADPVHRFHTDMPEHIAKEHAATLEPHSTAALNSLPGPLTFKDSGFDGRRAYIITEQDQAVPACAQESMIKASGVDWQVKKIQAAHSAHLSRAKDVTEYLVQLAQQWMAEV